MDNSDHIFIFARQGMLEFKNITVVALEIAQHVGLTSSLLYGVPGMEEFPSRCLLRHNFQAMLAW